MARLEEVWCERHHWAAADGDYRSRCPRCAEEREANKRAWEALPLDQKVEKLREWVCGSNWPSL